MQQDVVLALIKAATVFVNYFSEYFTVLLGYTNKHHVCAKREESLIVIPNIFGSFSCRVSGMNLLQGSQSHSLSCQLTNPQT